MQLDRVPPRPPAEADFGRIQPAGGVVAPEAFAGADARVPHLPARARVWWGVGLVALMLLGAGEPWRADPRFRSPSATLDTYWQALRHDDEFTAEECQLEPSHDVPMPGSLWFLPPTTALRVANLHSLPVESGRVMVTYEVRFVPLGGEGEQVFRTAAELVRDRGEWRIGRPIGEVSLPEWKPIRRTVDI